MDLQSIFLQLLSVAEKPLLKGLVNSLYEKHPTDAKLAIAELYPLIDTKLEALVKSTTSTGDDAIIQKAKEVCEELAAEWGMQLSNVDAD